MKITYRTLAQLIARMDNAQLDSDVTVEIPQEGSCCECYAAELRLAGDDHDGGLDDGHPVIYTHILSDAGERRDDVAQLVPDVGLDGQDNDLTFSWIVADASNGGRMPVQIKPDMHGGVVSFEGQPQSLIFDLSAGCVNVYITNADGEADTGSIGTIKMV